MKRKVAVIGLGRSGIGAAKLLKKEGHEVIVLERGNGPTFEVLAEELERKGINIALGKPLELTSFEPYIDQLESVIISPGIAWDHQTLKGLRNLGITIKGEIGLAWERLNKFPWIGITGTNGKTTVTYMLNHVLEQNSLSAPMAGNVGKAAAELAINLFENKKEPDWIIMELSSYQLEEAPEIAPQIGIWTNLTPDHLDRHKSMNAYSDIKKRLLDQSQIRIYNADDNYLRDNKDSLKKGIWISSQQNYLHEGFIDFYLNHDGMVLEKGKELFHSSALGIPGKHNIQNLLLTTAAAREVGLSGKQIERSLMSFKGVPHRLELIGSYQTIEIFNDSKATNYESSTMGLLALKTPIVLLAGGQAKEGNASQWLEQIHKKTCGVILFGSSASHLEKIIRSSGYKKDLYCFPRLKEAVDIAINVALENKAKSILLSPACASFDQYKNFEDRGDHFNKLIQRIQNR